MSEGCVGDMVELGITESYQVKRQVLLSASEAAEMILRVDDIIKSAPRWALTSLIVCVSFVESELWLWLRLVCVYEAFILSILFIIMNII